MGVSASQLLLAPTPLATLAATAQAASSTTFTIAQFYLIGKMSVSQNATLPPFTLTARINTGSSPYSHWLVGYGALGDFVQAATATTIRTAAAAQTLPAFVQAAAAMHPGISAVAAQTFAITTVATAASILKLTAGQILPFASTGAVSTVDKLVAAQTLPPFAQLATIPGYAAFVANARTYQPIAQLRGYAPTPELRSNAVTPENRTNPIS